MSIDKTGQTRDLVIELATRFEALEARVSKNSAILERLDAFVTEAKGAGRVGRVLWDGGKLVFAGGAGAGLWTWIQGTLPRLALTFAILVTPPVWAAVDGADGWILEVKICHDGQCRIVRKNAGGTWRCIKAHEALQAAVPSSSNRDWGYPEGTPVQVSSRCIEGPPQA